MKPRGRRYRRLLIAGAASCVIAGAFGFVEAFDRAWGDPLQSLSSLIVVLAGAGLVAIGVALAEEDARRWKAAWDALFADDELRYPGSDWNRWPRPPRRPRPRVLDEPRDSAWWMKKLADRYARLARLEELRAPGTVLEQERRLIREAIAQLSPADALAVMRSWPQLASERARKRGNKRRKAPPTDDAN